MDVNDTGYQMAKLLLEYGASANATPSDSENAQVLLHAAVRRKRDPIVELLLEHGADPNVVSKIGQTALHIACSHWSVLDFCSTQENLVEILLRAGADPTQQDLKGLRPVRFAQTARLQQKLLRAERWWCRRSFRLSLQCISAGLERRSMKDDSLGVASQASSSCMGLKEITCLIESFL
jgi:hypothetical protein